MSAPDFVEPIVGYRTWHVMEGELVPWSAGKAGSWVPGVNTARCLHEPDRPGHHPPVAHCSCGLYALADANDDRLWPDQDAVGAVVAWGDVEVHRAGFRAQYATVVALALPANAEPRHEAKLRAAAARYGVPLVPPDRLTDAALEYGRPIAFDAIPPTPRTTTTRSATPPLGAHGTEGIAIDEHLVATIEADGIRLAPTDALTTVLDEEARWVEEGTVVKRGDIILRSGGEEGLAVRSPLSGFVCAEGTIRPSDWDREGADLAWGRAGQRLYASTVAAQTDPFVHLRIRWIHAHAHVRSAKDVLEALREQRARPRFATEGEVYERIGDSLRAALADPAVASAAARLPKRIAWRLHDPESDLLLDRAGVECGAPPEDGDLVVFATAEAADDYFAGRLDFAAALRSREIQSSSPPGQLLSAASVLKPLHARYATATR